jgi:hypothetical protein
MHRIAPIAKDTATESLEKRLRHTADQFRANSASDARSCEQELRRQLIEVEVEDDNFVFNSGKSHSWAAVETKTLAA